jgi:hypothetical protein
MSTDRQPQNICTTMKVHHQLVEDNPEEYVNNRRQIERFTSTYMQQTSRAGLRRGGIVTTPCVVHVVYNDSAENISDEQIFSQIW